MAGISRAWGSANSERAEQSEASLDFRQALLDYKATLDHPTPSDDLERIRARIQYLQSHSEGGFVPLARLERLRRDPTLNRDLKSVAAFYREAEKFPPGLVRGEAFLLAADAFKDRFGNVDEALHFYRRVVEGHDVGPEDAWRARHELVVLLAKRGDIAGAWAATQDAVETDARANPARAAPEPELVTLIRRYERRANMHSACICAIVLAAVVFLVSLARGTLAIARATLQRSGPRLGAAALYLGGAGAALASVHTPGTAEPFLLMGVALLPLWLAARVWGSVGSSSPLFRGSRALVCAASALAAAFLVLEHVDPAYLEGLGL